MSLEWTQTTLALCILVHVVREFGAEGIGSMSLFVSKFSCVLVAQRIIGMFRSGIGRKVW